MEGLPRCDLDFVGHSTHELVVRWRGDLNRLDRDLLCPEPSGNKGLEGGWGLMIDLASLPRQNDILKWADNLFPGGKRPVPEGPCLLLDRLSQSKDPVILVFRLGIETVHERKVRKTVVVPVENKMAVSSAELRFSRHGEMGDPNPDLLLRFRVEAYKISEKGVIAVFQRDTVRIPVANRPYFSECRLFGRKNPVSNFDFPSHNATPD